MASAVVLCSEPVGAWFAIGFSFEPLTGYIVGGEALVIAALALVVIPLRPRARLSGLMGQLRRRGQ
ncbi:MAG: hypothetical protein ACK5KO_05595 [Arachnia sp.]